ncbi:MAG TPA: ATP-dependent DNA helicase RecG [Ktedonobacterales bacterium]|nr:ATP-dependent DNA helicase RecG [Ktedonobacterales bacterium]
MHETPARAGKQSDSARQLIERAQNILAYEQRSGHQDTVVKPGGIEAFVGRWATQMRDARDRGEIAAPPAGASGRLPEVAILHLLTGYHALDPMQRAANIRASLALLDAFDTPETAAKPPAARANLAPRREAPRFGQPANGRAQSRPSTSAEEPWPLAKPLPKPPVLPAERPRSAEPPREPRPEDEYLLQAAVTAVPGVGATQEARLARLGIQTVRDLLFDFPREHHDYSTLQKIGQLPFETVSTTLGLIWDVENKRTKNGRTRTVARVSDETGAVYATWFNQPYLLKQLPRGTHIVMTGTKQRFGNRVEFAVKSHELPEQGDLINTGRLVPVYGLTEGLSPKVMRRFTKWAVDRCAPFVPEHLPPEVRSRAKLMPLPDAVAEMHYPQNGELLASARRRLAFDELFLIQLGMLTRRANWKDGSPSPAMPVPESLIFADVSADAPGDTAGEMAASNPGGGLWPLTATCFESTLPFSLTGAQRRTIREVLSDMRGTHPMSRLLQGDVGSGKTVVAAAALLAAAANGYQGALLAPTEILAEQHYRGLSALLAPFGLHVVLLTGSQRAKERNAARDALANEQAAVAIGTHALIQEGVSFARLGLAVVDEQHRFGVEQRDALRQKGYNPHMLVMTATPIPRTLALTLYGDLDVSVLDEMPAGRQPIITRWRSGTQRQEAYRLVADEVAQGRQAYIICPLVEESETLEAKAATQEYERLRTQVFPDLRLGLVHGQMRPAEKDRVMRAFRDGEIDVLVATSVVEVGVDVPNATVMLIEDAERFGLSQLHQFRGRVGRGAHQSYCYLLSHDAGMTARERLSVLEQTTDGFVLADADLRLRGPGDFFGTRQSGLPELKVATMADTPLLALARTTAEWLWQRDPYLRASEHAALRERVFLFWRNFAAH